ncbi:MAG: hypothetical protein CMG57_08670 [Candidatus Marinimicrobia bacterium]|nr:hypothetical protein [Candidatus Neomarinimicrobiota bacterium]
MGQVKNFIFEFDFVPALSDINILKYTSYAFSIFGELFTLFGAYKSIPVYFLLGFIIQWIM